MDNHLDNGVSLSNLAPASNGGETKSAADSDDDTPLSELSAAGGSASTRGYGEPPTVGAGEPGNRWCGGLEGCDPRGRGATGGCNRCGGIFSRPMPLAMSPATVQPKIHAHSKFGLNVGDVIVMQGDPRHSSEAIAGERIVALYFYDHKDKSHESPPSAKHYTELIEGTSARHMQWIL
jgi:hypothetical protein